MQSMGWHAWGFAACLALLHDVAQLQVVHLEEADKEGEDAAAFYSALGVDSPASISIKAAASQANS